MNKLLLVVDPQIDFINGSLPVPDAESAMNNLAEFISSNNGNYCYKIATVDWHPHNHCSFATNDGQWPDHCVQHSEGAAIWPSVLKALHTTKGDTIILSKGLNSATEEYSIFKNVESTALIDEIIKKYRIDKIDICGIAGDICVLDTLKDGIAIYGPQMFNILSEFSPSLDKGAILNEFKNNLTL